MWILSVFLCFADTRGYDGCKWIDIFEFKTRNECIVTLHNQATFGPPTERLGQGFGAARCRQKTPTLEK